MRHVLRTVATAMAGAAVVAVLWLATMPLASQSSAYRAPRTPDGKPDLNGIWQALNEANYDIEAHVARPAMALRPGPYGPVPEFWFPHVFDMSPWIVDRDSPRSWRALTSRTRARWRAMR